MGPPDDVSRVYLESCCVIAAFKDEPGAEPIHRVIEATQRGEIELVTSAMLLVEARGQGKGPAFDETLEAEVLKYLDHPRWLLVELTRSVALRARRLAIDHGMDNPDAVHLASAIEAEADVLMTLDDGFPLDSEVGGVWITKPYFLGGPDLFSGQ